MVNIDPLVNIVAPRDRPDLEQAARSETFDDTFAAWDMLAGITEPELGGSPEILDVVGVNCYSFGQMEYREQGPHAALPPDDDRIVPLCDLLDYAWKRYRRPMLIAETSGLEAGRTAWLRDVMEESLAAVARGIDLHGICLFPAVDMRDWHTGEWLHSGICDLSDDEEMRRLPDPELTAELRRWQEALGRVKVLDEDPLSDAVDLHDIVEAAKRYRGVGDKDWA